MQLSTPSIPFRRADPRTVERTRNAVVIEAPPPLAPAQDREAERPEPVHTSTTRFGLFRFVPTSLAACFVVLVSAAFTGFNLFGYPHYESDEGTYIGSAWSMFNEGKLAYYTYNYDHPLFGWFLLGAWSKLLDGLAGPSSSIDTGRVFMLLLTVLSALLIFEIVRRVTGRRAAGVFAAVVFSVSPLALALHRQVWLDNITTFWVLLALFLLIVGRGNLGWCFCSSIAFGLSFWSKETAAVFLPAMLFVVYTQAHAAHRRFAFVLWSAGALSICSVFVLLALLKDELLPPGVLWSSDLPHVSMLGTYAWQMSRGGDGSIFNANSQIRQFWDQWWQADRFLVLGGLATSLLALALIRRARLFAGVALLADTYLLFLARGGVVLNYYILPVLPLFAVLIGLALGYGHAWLSRWRFLRRAIGPLLLVGSLYAGTAAALADVPAFTQQPTTSQNQAASWMIANLPHDSVILMDSYAWSEMRDPKTTGGDPFPNAEYYWPALSDPTILGGLLHNDWHTVDYVAVSPSVQADLNQGLPVLQDAIQNSDRIETFYSGDWSIDIMRVRKLQTLSVPTDPFLTNAWATYKQDYIHQGQFVDPGTGLTSSELQSYSLLRAVYADDQTTFDQVWSWTQAHLQTPADGLLSWQWGLQEDGTEGVLDPSSASDADEDTALALLFAAKQWNDASYESDAQTILNGIWTQETTLVAGRPVLVAGDWARGDSSIGLPDPVINPSYFAPYEYRIFASADPSHPWSDLVDSSYDVLASIRSTPGFGGDAGLVPNWVELDSATGDLEPADAMGPNWSQFGYDASRLPFRLALDWLWFKDDRAKQALAGISLPGQELAQSGRLGAAYNSDGSPAANNETTSMYATNLAGVLVSQDPSLAEQVFAQKVLGAYQNDASGTYWGDINDYYGQNWAWFATALMDGGLSNLWAGQTVTNWDGPALP